MPGWRTQNVAGTGGLASGRWESRVCGATLPAAHSLRGASCFRGGRQPPLGPLECLRKSIKDCPIQGALMGSDTFPGPHRDLQSMGP